MLTKIYCDKFESYGKPRGIIHFHPGLNTVLGGKSAENSIGKSTFLLAIDFAFGGTTFSQASDVGEVIGNHSIGFTFEFDGVEYHFCRDLANDKTVNICDDDSYVPNGKTLKLSEFTSFLSQKYEFVIPELSFRDGAGRYMRINGKENVFDPKRPLHSSLREKDEKAIAALEKLFEVYDKIDSYKKAEAEAKNDNKVFKEARKIGLLPQDITSETKFKKNEKKIEELTAERDKLIEDQDVELTEKQLQYTREVEKIKVAIQNYKREYSRLSSEFRVVELNLEGKIPPTESDIQELGSFFPGVDLKKIEEIEAFHHKMQEILTEEFKEAGENITEMMESVKREIETLEKKLRKLGVPSNLSTEFLDEYNDINAKIGWLRSQNEAYIKMKDYKEKLDNATEVRKTKEKEIVFTLAQEINAQMTRYNDRIYGGMYLPPVIDLDDGQHYTFKTPRDSGTGTAFKSWIVFDLSVLKLTRLPMIIHDSLLFKNIADAPVEKILNLYQEFKDNQIFIAFDKNEAYSSEVEAITEKTKVLQLDSGGNELYGYAWNKK